MAQPPIVNIIVQQRQTNLFLRILYYLFIGWWLGFLWLNLGYLLLVSILGLPLGLVMLNRLPTVMTLRPMSQSMNIQVTGNAVTLTMGSAQQWPLLARAAYFLFVGWWAGYMWIVLGYFLCLLIVTLPLGIMMLNRLPMILTLRKN